MPVRLSIITQEDLSDFVGGRLSANEEAEIAAFVESDPRAKSIVEELRRTSERVASRVGRDRREKAFEFEQ